MRRIFHRGTGKLSADERGTAAVEMGLIALPMFLMLFGILEWGRYMYTYNTLQFGCEQAVRYGVMHISAPGAAVAIQNYAIAQMPGVDLPAGQPVVTIDAAANTVQVTATIQFDFLIDLVAPDNVTIVGRAKM
jgi:Flp pilus assembly protein TadG